MRKQLMINTNKLEYLIINTDFEEFIIEVFSHAGLPQRE